MKKSLSVAVVSLMLSTGTALADSGTASNRSDWSGAYASVGLSYTHSSFSTNTAYNPARATKPGISLILGHSFQQDDLVYGAEIVGNFSNIKGNSTGCGIGAATCSSIVQNYLVLRGRLGVAVDDFLVFGTLGVISDRMSQLVNGSGISQRHYGISAGVGAEYALDEHWSVRGDLEYHHMGKKTYALPAPAGVTSVRPSHVALRLGMSYRF